MASPKDVRAWLTFTNTCLSQRIDEEKNTLQTNNGGAKPDDNRNNNRKDMFHHIFLARGPQTGGPGYTIDELKGETNLLVIAGADTTATAFAAMFFYLVRNPNIQETLDTEIRNTFNSVEEIRAGQKMMGCRYLRGFIDETLRMNPPILGPLEREVLAGGIDIDGLFVPEGCNVGVASYCLHRNGDVFEDPGVFRPERWMANNNEKGMANEEERKKNRQEAAFVPFSAGLRGCPGRSLAYQEMSIVMARILFRADVRGVEDDELGAGREDWGRGRRDKGQYQIWDGFVCMREGPMVQFRPVRP